MSKYFFFFTQSCTLTIYLNHSTKQTSHNIKLTSINKHLNISVSQQELHRLPSTGWVDRNDRPSSWVIQCRSTFPSLLVKNQLFNLFRRKKTFRCPPLKIYFFLFLHLQSPSNVLRFLFVYGYGVAAHSYGVACYEKLLLEQSGFIFLIYCWNISSEYA